MGSSSSTERPRRWLIPIAAVVALAGCPGGQGAGHGNTVEQARADAGEPAPPRLRLGGEVRPLRDQDRQSWVELAAAASCAVGAHLQVHEVAPTSPEAVERLGAFVEHRGSLQDYVAIASHANTPEGRPLSVALSREVAVRCPEVGYRADRAEVVEALRLRRLSLTPGASDRELDPARRRYLEVALALGCAALDPSADDEGLAASRAEALEAGGYDEASFDEAAGRFRDDPAVDAALARGLEGCASR